MTIDKFILSPLYKLFVINDSIKAIVHLKINSKYTPQIHKSRKTENPLPAALMHIVTQAELNAFLSDEVNNVLLRSCISLNLVIRENEPDLSLHSLFTLFVLVLMHECSISLLLF